MEEELEKMDAQCNIIILTLLAYEKQRFNKLFRILKYYDPKLSTRTLAEHLKHLTNKGWIIRKEEAKQYVTYELTEDKINFLKPAIPEIKEQVEEWSSIEDKLSGAKITKINLSPKDFANFLFLDMISTYLEELKREITFKFTTENISKDIDFILFDKPAHRELAKGLINKCLENAEFGAEVILKIDELHEKIKKEIVNGSWL
jgi:DNA-binding HxlR family transcriptional regulator